MSKKSKKLIRPINSRRKRAYAKKVIVNNLQFDKKQYEHNVRAFFKKLKAKKVNQNQTQRGAKMKKLLNMFKVVFNKTRIVVGKVSGKAKVVVLKTVNKVKEKSHILLNKLKNLFKRKETVEVYS